jgi:hypothetical protein
VLCLAGADFTLGIVWQRRRKIARPHNLDATSRHDDKTKGETEDGKQDEPRCAGEVLKVATAYLI